MCGIALYIDKNASQSELLEAYRALGKDLSHRGPDSMGVFSVARGKTEGECRYVYDKRIENLGLYPCNVDFFENSWGFGLHHRLAIINPIQDSIQPFVCGTYKICYNGEVYNYIELRKELQCLGVEFETQSDTEVVLRAFEKWGNGCFERFNGDFAIAIYNAATRRITVARDRWGVKPLFYLRDKERFVVSSEVLSFRGLPRFKPELNKCVAYDYLAATFPTQDTLKGCFLKGIKVVPPASILVYDLERDSLERKSYWCIESAKNGLQRQDDFKRVKQFSVLLEDAVKIRLRADVPLGAFLSGGMDSSSIVRYAQKYNEGIYTFSTGFPGSDSDESERISVLARKMGVSNALINIDYDAFISTIENLVEYQDEPFPILNVYSQYMNLVNAKQSGTKVILDGGGADEYLAGYYDYQLLAALDCQDPRFLDGYNKQAYRYIREYGESAYLMYVNRTQHDKRRVNYLSDDARKIYRGNCALDRPMDENYFGQYRGSYLKHALKLSLTGSWMNKSVQWDNRYLDRSGMRLGVEVRVPFQDHRLTDFVFAQPVSFLFRDGYSKWGLREAMRARFFRMM